MGGYVHLHDDLAIIATAMEVEEKTSKTLARRCQPRERGGRDIISD